MKTKQWSSREFKKMLKKNGFFFVRQNGSHAIFKNDMGNEVVVNSKLNQMVALRLIKENNLQS